MDLTNVLAFMLTLAVFSFLWRIASFGFEQPSRYRKCPNCYEYLHTFSNPRSQSGRYVWWIGCNGCNIEKSGSTKQLAQENWQEFRESGEWREKFKQTNGYESKSKAKHSGYQS